MSEVDKIKQEIEMQEKYLQGIYGAWEVGGCGIYVDLTIIEAEIEMKKLYQKLQEYEQETRS